MKIDKKKHFIRLPVYLIIVYFLASIPITIYLEMNATQPKQFAQSDPSSTPLYVLPTFKCLANKCPIDNISPTVYGMIISSVPTTPSEPTLISTPAITSGVVTVSNDPCPLTSVSSQTYSVSTHRGHGGHGFFDFFINLVIYLFNLIIQLIGYPPLQTGDPAPTSSSLYVIPTSEIISSAPSPKPCPTDTLKPTTPSEPTLISTPAITSGIDGGTNADVKVSYYNANGGWTNAPAYANSPGVIHNQMAGGTGTFDDPLTFAALPGSAYTVAGKIYVPFLQKYFILEDKCPGCNPTQVDLYMGNPSNDAGATACANNLTIGENIKPIIVNPPAGLTYDPTPIWDQKNNKCITPH
jgi:hypothetical protein